MIRYSMIIGIKVTFVNEMKFVIIVIKVAFANEKQGFRDFRD